jgi:hypothetical protein
LRAHQANDSLWVCLGVARLVPCPQIDEDVLVGEDAAALGTL